MLFEPEDADDGFWKRSFPSPCPSGVRNKIVAWIEGLVPIRMLRKKVHEMRRRDAPLHEMVSDSGIRHICPGDTQI